MQEQTVKCNICGQPYKVYMFMAGDQSACPSCRAQAQANMMTTTTVIYKKIETSKGEG